MEDGAFALFFRPQPGGFASSRVPTPRNLPSKAKKMLIPGGQPGGAWAQVELTDALPLKLLTTHLLVRCETEEKGKQYSKTIHRLHFPTVSHVRNVIKCA